MKRFIRVAGVAVGVLATVAVPTPPAHAHTTAEATFIGYLTVVGGFGYPVLTLQVTAPGTSCLAFLPDGNPVPNCHPVYDHQRMMLFYSVTFCTDEVTNVAKASKPLETTGACGIYASGTLTGHCSLSGGQLSGTYVDSWGQPYDFDVHFTEVGDWVITGHVTKRWTGASGKIVGDVRVWSEADFTGNQSCINKTQEDFIVVGETQVVIIND